MLDFHFFHIYLNHLHFLSDREQQQVKKTMSPAKLMIPLNMNEIHVIRGLFLVISKIPSSSFHLQFEQIVHSLLIHLCAHCTWSSTNCRLLSKSSLIFFQYFRICFHSLHHLLLFFFDSRFFFYFVINFLIFNISVVCNQFSHTISVLFVSRFIHTSFSSSFFASLISPPGFVSNFRSETFERNLYTFSYNSQ